MRVLQQALDLADNTRHSFLNAPLPLLMLQAFKPELLLYYCIDERENDASQAFILDAIARSEQCEEERNPGASLAI